MKLSCKVYQDLIPLYVENLLSSDSKDLLEVHLTNCPDCQNHLIQTTENLASTSLAMDSANKAVLIKKLNRQINLTQWAFLSCGIFLSILFTLSDTLEQNIIFLPLMGLISYFFTRKAFSIPLLLSILLTFTLIFKDVMTAGFDGIFGYFFYLVIFFFLTLVGTLCGYILKHASKGFKLQTNQRKLGTVTVWLLIMGLGSVALLFTNSMNGNPITASYAQLKMRDYLEENYPDMTANLGTAQYSFKDGCYHSTARLYTEEFTHTFDIYYRGNNVWDDYFVSYLEDVNRYDVVVTYITPEDNLVSSLNGTEYYIKRVIGLPGDQITWLKGVLTINGKIIDETYFDTATKLKYKQDYEKGTEFNGQFKYKENGEIKSTYIMKHSFFDAE